MIVDNFGDLLRWRRDLLGKTQAVVAREAGTAQATISRLEQGRRDVRLTTLIEVARALGLDVRVVPREVLPAVDDLIRSTTSRTAGGQSEAPLYSLDDIDADAP